MEGLKPRLRTRETVTCEAPDVEPEPVSPTLSPLGLHARVASLIRFCRPEAASGRNAETRTVDVPSREESAVRRTSAAFAPAGGREEQRAGGPEGEGAGAAGLRLLRVSGGPKGGGEGLAGDRNGSEGQACSGKRRATCVSPTRKRPSAASARSEGSEGGRSEALFFQRNLRPRTGPAQRSAAKRSEAGSRVKTHAA